MVIDIKTRRPLVEPAVDADVLEVATADFVLRSCLKTADNIDEIVILMKDKDGQLGFVGNLDGLGETLLFLDTVKALAIAQRVDSPSGGNS